MAGKLADTDENGDADSADASQRGSAQIIFLNFSICVHLRLISVICVLFSKQHAELKDGEGREPGDGELRDHTDGCPSAA